ncbi:MAG TPA: hypothetical protein VF469_01035 [Kofleriaceae bacterium]
MRQSRYILTRFARSPTASTAGGRASTTSANRRSSAWSSTRAPAGIAGDPSFVHGVVARWTVVEWKDILF